MKTIRLLLCLLCMLFVDVKQVCSDTETNSTFIINSAPEGTSVFHYFRGNNDFIGYTPLKLSKDKLNGKSQTKLLLAKFGYKQELFDVEINGKDQYFELKPEKLTYLISNGDTKTNVSECETKTIQAIQKIIHKSMKNQIIFQLPFKWVEDSFGIKIVMIANILNHEHIKNIKKVERKDKSIALTYVEELLTPAIKHFINVFKNEECLDRLFVIAVCEDRGVRVDFKPYQEYWHATHEYMIGNIKYIETGMGSTTELKKDILVLKKSKSFLFEYKLH